MTKEMEKEIDNLYELLKITPKDDVKNNENVNTEIQRTSDFFEKRWDSSFFASTLRY